MVWCGFVLCCVVLYCVVWCGVVWWCGVWCGVCYGGVVRVLWWGWGGGGWGGVVGGRVAFGVVGCGSLSCVWGGELWFLVVCFACEDGVNSPTDAAADAAAHALPPTRLRAIARFFCLGSLACTPATISGCGWSGGGGSSPGAGGVQRACRGIMRGCLALLKVMSSRK